MCPNTSEEIEHMSRIFYALMIRSLMHVMLCTQPDIILAMSVTSRYQSNLSEEHWIAMKNILKYLRRTKDLFLIFGGAPKLWIKGYIDLDFMSDPDDKNLHRGMCSFAMMVQSVGSVLSRVSSQIQP